MLFGEIELDSELGGFEIVNMPAGSIPQEAASAVFGAINSGILGATYIPLWYIGSQVVKGKNHLFLAKEIRATKHQNTSIVGLLINVPPHKGAFTGEGATVVKIIEEAQLSDELACIFKTATQSLVGVSYKPLFYVGHQVVKGMNHYFIAQAQAIYPGADPFLVSICINDFNKNISIISIEKLEHTVKTDVKLGYAFTW